MKKLLTDEQEKYLISNVKHTGNKELTKLINDKFKTDFSVTQIKAWKNRHKISSDLTGHFEKGNIPHNKGKKGYCAPGSEKGWFKKGQKPVNHRVIGSERLTKDGYIEMKTREPSEWNLKHRIVWERNNGPIPKNGKIIFLDGNRENCNLDNLRLVASTEHVRMNKNHWRFEDPKKTLIGITLAKLQVAKSERKQSHDS